jgi:hypothetical protein
MTHRSLPPHRIRDAVLSALRGTIRRLKSPEVVLAVSEADEDVRGAWAGRLLDATKLRDELERSRLREIAEGLVANEGELLEAGESLAAALEDFAKLGAGLESARAFLGIVAGILGDAR